MTDELRAVPADVINALIGVSADEGVVAWDVVAKEHDIALYPVRSMREPSMSLMVPEDDYGDEYEIDYEDEPMEEHGADLTARQSALMAAHESITYEFGQWSQREAHYMEQNPFVNEGLHCANCTAYEGGRRCYWVEGEIDPDAICKLWVIPQHLQTSETRKEIRREDGKFCVKSKDGKRSFGCYASEGEAEKRLAQIERFAKAAYSPPADVRAAARRALEWIADGKAGSGFTDVGRKRASDLARGASVSGDTIARMRSFFSRHESTSKGATGFRSGEDGFPTPGRVAWDAWGGDAGKRWANAMASRMEARTEKATGEVSLVKSVDEERFTLAPWYIPDRVDAHGEWTDSNELQKALWRYVREADRDIRLQHQTEIKAGEWLEAVTWPFPIEVPMRKSNGTTSNVEFPANTVFLGVQWEPWAWDLVKEGKINGYSVGGKSKRLLVDFEGD